MLLMVPMPIPHEELANLEKNTLEKYGISFDELMRTAITSWEFMSSDRLPTMDDVVLVSVDAELFHEWYEASRRLTDITHQLGRAMYRMLEPGLQGTFGSADEIDIRYIKSVPNGILLDMRGRDD